MKGVRIGNWRIDSIHVPTARKYLRIRSYWTMGLSIVLNFLSMTASRISAEGARTLRELLRNSMRNSSGLRIK
jgi:hypothetical protein